MNYSKVMLLLMLTATVAQSATLTTITQESTVTKYATTGGWIELTTPDNSPIHIAILRDGNYTMEKLYEYIDKETGEKIPYTANSTKVYYTFYIGNTYEDQQEYTIEATINNHSVSQTFTVTGYREEPFFYDIWLWLETNIGGVIVAILLFGIIVLLLKVIFA